MGRDLCAGWSRDRAPHYRQPRSPMPTLTDVVMEQDFENVSLLQANQASMELYAVDVIASVPEIPGPPTWNACNGTCPGLVMSTPVYTSWMYVLVQKVRADSNFERLFTPFEGSVWIAAFTTIVILAATMVVVRTINPRTCPEHRVSVRSFTNALYFAMIAALGGEDEAAPWPCGPSRIIRIAATVFTLVLTAAYTANLAAFFTAPSIVLQGPTSLNALHKATACIPLNFLTTRKPPAALTRARRCPAAAAAPPTQQPTMQRNASRTGTPRAAAFTSRHVGEIISPPPEVAQQGLGQALDWCHRAVIDGTVRLGGRRHSWQ